MQSFQSLVPNPTVLALDLRVRFRDAPAKNEAARAGGMRRQRCVIYIYIPMPVWYNCLQLGKFLGATLGKYQR